MRALLILALSLLLAGCASPGRFDGVTFEHDFSDGAPRARTFDVPNGVALLDVFIEIGPTGDDPLHCTVAETARAALLDPTSKETVVVEATGEPNPGVDSEVCTVNNAERRHTAKPGTWTLSFSGEGDLRAYVRVTTAE